MAMATGHHCLRDRFYIDRFTMYVMVYNRKYRRKMKRNLNHRVKNKFTGLLFVIAVVLLLVIVFSRTLI